jgi:hypothetical protein
MPKACQNCGKQDRLAACRACSRAHYCSVECQKIDWKFHKEHCQIEKRDAPVMIPPAEPAVAPVQPKETPAFEKRPKTLPKQKELTMQKAVKDMLKLHLVHHEEKLKSVEDAFSTALANSSLSQPTKHKLLKFATDRIPALADIIAKSQSGDVKGMDIVHNALVDFARLVGYSEEQLSSSEKEEEEALKMGSKMAEDSDSQFADYYKEDTVIHEPFESLTKPDGTFLDRIDLIRVMSRNRARAIGNACFPDFPANSKHFDSDKNGIFEVPVEDINKAHRAERQRLVDEAFVDYENSRQKSLDEWMKFLEDVPTNIGPLEGSSRRSPVRFQIPKKRTASPIRKGLLSSLYSTVPLKPAALPAKLAQLPLKNLYELQTQLQEEYDRSVAKAYADQTPADSKFLTNYEDYIKALQNAITQAENEPKTQPVQYQQIPSPMPSAVQTESATKVGSYFAFSFPIILMCLLGFWAFGRVLSTNQVNTTMTTETMQQSVDFFTTWHKDDLVNVSADVQSIKNLSASIEDQMKGAAYYYKEEFKKRSVITQVHEEMMRWVSHAGTTYEVETEGGETETVYIPKVREQLPDLLANPKWAAHRQMLRELVMEHTLQVVTRLRDLGTPESEIAEIMVDYGVLRQVKAESQKIGTVATGIVQYNSEKLTYSVGGSDVSISSSKAMTVLQDAIQAYQLPPTVTAKFMSTMERVLSDTARTVKEENLELERDLIGQYEALKVFHRTVESFSGLSKRNFDRLHRFVTSIEEHIQRNINDAGTHLLYAWIDYQDKIKKRESFWKRHKGQTVDFFKELTSHFITLFSSPLRYELMSFSVDMHDDFVLEIVRKMTKLLKEDVTDTKYESKAQEWLEKLDFRLGEQKSTTTVDDVTIALRRTAAKSQLFASMGVFIEHWDRWRFAAAQGDWQYFTPNSFLIGRGLYLLIPGDVIPQVLFPAYWALQAMFSYIEGSMFVSAISTMTACMFNKNVHFSGDYIELLYNSVLPPVAATAISALMFLVALCKGKDAATILGHSLGAVAWKLLNYGFLFTISGMTTLSQQINDGLSWPSLANHLVARELQQAATHYHSSPEIHWDFMKKALNTAGFDQFNNFIENQRAMEAAHNTATAMLEYQKTETHGMKRITADQLLNIDTALPPYKNVYNDAQLLEALYSAEEYDPQKPMKLPGEKYPPGYKPGMLPAITPGEKK